MGGRTSRVDSAFVRSPQAAQRLVSARCSVTLTRTGGGSKTCRRSRVAPHLPCLVPFQLGL